MSTRLQGLAGLALGLCLAGPGCARAPAPDPADTQPRPVATAPTGTLLHAHELQRQVEDAVDNFLAKRVNRLGRALEPNERDFGVLLYNPRLHRQFTPLEATFNAGEELFESELTTMEGFGDGDGGKIPNMHRVHRGAHGGPDTSSCRSCHHRGGDDGAGEYTEAALTGGDGENTVNSNERNAPSILGSGAMQILAREISEELQAQSKLVATMDYERDLIVQGVNFGTITVRMDGSIDTSKLKAIDPDLVVRPFGWKGTHSLLRRFAEEAFQVHHGMQSEALTERRRVFGPWPMGASAATAAIEASLGNGPPNDPDSDAKERELTSYLLNAVSVYLTLLPLPVMDPPRAPDLQIAFREGERTFREVGCDSCHKPYWLIKSPVWHEVAEGIGSEHDFKLDLRKDIQRGAQLRSPDALHYEKYPIFVFSDLKRHDMGPELADRWEGGPKAHANGDHQGPEIPPSYFLTRPLWGLADTAPYLHDGRAGTIPEAIVMHGGEAAPVVAAYRKLAPERQRALHVFLLSLARPPIPEIAP